MGCSNATAPPEPTKYPDQKQLADFFADCEKDISGWREGQIDYPARLSMDMGRSIEYVAAVDIRNSPLPAEKEISGGIPGSAPVAVQCVLSARLVPVEDALEVDNREWILRKFTPTGVLNWSWAIKALAPGEHEVRLELEPAVTTSSEDILLQGGSPPEISTHISQVHVTASWIQLVGQWWQDNWGILVLVVGGIGAALVSLIKWGGDVGQALRDSSAKVAEEKKE